MVRYLARRGITLPPPPSLHWAPGCRHPSRIYLPAMVAKVVNIDGDLIGVHRTFLQPDGSFLQPDGSGKADIEPQKASLGPISGGAVRLAPAAETLLIGEGIETCIAALQATSMPAWATLSTAGMVALQLPPIAREIIILADHDANGAGQRAAYAAADRWLAEGRRYGSPCRRYRELISPTCCSAAPMRGSRRNVMSPPNGIAEVRRILGVAKDVTPEPPRPLTRELPPADPFPVDTLGDVLASAARAIHDRVQAPLAIGAQSALGAAALAVQGHADVVLPIGPGQSRPLTCYLITIALSGERKSACDTAAMWPIRRRETALRAQHEIDYVRYIDDRAAYDEARKRATKTTKGDRATIRAMLYTLGPEPVPPLVPMLTCPEPTYEGMCRLLRVGHPSIGIFAAEGGQFIGGHGMKEEARLFTAAGLSALWDGDPIRRVRAVDGITILPGRRVSMHLMAQPTVADILLRDRLLADQGLLSRVLISAGDSAMGTRVRREGSAEANRAMECYGARLLSILEVPLPFVTDKPNELQPRRLTLSAAARRVWDGFADHVETMLGSDGELRAISGLANKLPEYAAASASLSLLQSPWSRASQREVSTSLGSRPIRPY